MTELKVECDCGQRYKFDVEPVNGQMPFTVACPACGVDGTHKANALLQENAAVPAAPIPIAPSPVAETPDVPPPTTPKLRINLSAHAPAVSAPPPVAPPLRPGLAPSTVPDPGKPIKTPSFGMGMLGAFLGALVGSAVYFLIFKYTGIRLKLLAIGVGYLAGAGAEWLGKSEGSKELGGIAAIFALAGVVGAQYIVALGLWHEVGLSTDFGKSAYAINVGLAKTTMAAIPTGSDAEIRNYLAQQAADDGDDTNISAADIKDFRENQLPELQDLASGKMTKEQYDAKHGINAMQEAKEADREDMNFQSFFLLLFVSKANIFSLIAAAALAFRVSANA